MNKKTVLEYRTSEGRELMREESPGKWQLIPCSVDLETLIELSEAIKDVLAHHSPPVAQPPPGPPLTPEQWLPSGSDMAERAPTPDSPAMEAEMRIQ